MPWPEIFSGGKAGTSIPKESLLKDARNELKRTSHDDIEQIVESRAAGKLRAWGVGHGNALMLMFWDPEHSFFPVEHRRRPTGN
jgi:hypothetical protein